MIDLNHLNFVTLPLTTGKDKKRRVPYRSGLNWGQRPGRNENQAYLSVPSEIQKLNFFPVSGIKFKLICDDGYEFFCIRAQQNGKAIHSCDDNSLIGKYFRKRLHLESGQPIIYEHLIRYGRTSVDIYKKENLIFYLNFSKITKT